MLSRGCPGLDPARSMYTERIGRSAASTACQHLCLYVYRAHWLGMYTERIGDVVTTTVTNFESLPLSTSLSTVDPPAHSHTSAPTPPAPAPACNGSRYERSCAQICESVDFASSSCPIGISVAKSSRMWPGCAEAKSRARTEYVRCSSSAPQCAVCAVQQHEKRETKAPRLRRCCELSAHSVSSVEIVCAPASARALVKKSSTVSDKHV
jgi:hypothetical protein